MADSEKSDNARNEKEDSLAKILDKKVDRRRAVSTAAKAAVVVGAIAVAGVGAGAYYATQPGQVTTTSRSTSQSTTQTTQTQTTQTQTAPSPTKQTLSVGVMAALTGPLACFFIAQGNAVKMAGDEINAKGGIKVGNAIYTLDPKVVDAWKPPDAISTLKRFVDVDKIKIVMDGATTSTLFALRDTVKSLDILMLWTTSLEPDVTKQVPNAFRNVFDFADKMDSYAKFFKELGVKTIGTTSYKGHHEYETLVNSLKSSGFTVLDEWTDPGVSDYLPILTKFKNAGVDCLSSHIPVGADLFNLIDQAYKIGILPAAKFVSFAAIIKPVVQGNFPVEKLEGFYELMSPSPAMWGRAAPEKNKQFLKAYSDKFGADKVNCWWSPEATHDGVYILAKAIEKAGTATDTKALANALSQLETKDIPELLLLYPEGKLFRIDPQGGGQALNKIPILQFKNGDFDVIKWI